MKYCIPRKLYTGSRAVGPKNKFWKPGSTLTIGFIGGTSEQHNFVKQYAADWEFLNLKFDWFSPTPIIRISFDKGDGAWSYVGTDNRRIDKSEATMNFGWLDPAVVRHEFGHMLGLGHEHQNPQGGIVWDEEQVMKDMGGPPNNWSARMIRWNVLDAYKETDIKSTEFDPDSIMLYQFPDSWTIGDFKTSFNEDISEKDREFMLEQYPFEKEVSPEEIRLVFLKSVFTTFSELKKLRKSTIISIGKELGIHTDKKYLKKVNAKLVWEHINA